MTISGHRGEASFRSYISHPLREELVACSDTLSDALNGCVEWKPTSITAAELYCAVIPRNRHVPGILLSFIHKTHAIGNFYSTEKVKTYVFL